MKPVIKIWLLPKELIEDGLREIHKSVVEAIESVGEFGLIGEGSMVVIIPPDRMDYGLGMEIVIEGYGFSEESAEFPEEKTAIEAVWVKLAFRIYKALEKFFPETFIQCSVGGPSGPYKGHWSSDDEKKS